MMHDMNIENVMQNTTRKDLNLKNSYLKIIISE